MGVFHGEPKSTGTELEGYLPAESEEEGGRLVRRALVRTWKREFKLPWREAGPPNHHDDKVDSNQ